jgi:hypothetical protein
MEASQEKKKVADPDYFQDEEKEEDFDSGVTKPNSSDKKSAAELKKQSSYTYWVQNNREQFPQHQDKALIAPKKIEDPELLKKLEEQTSTLTLTKTGSAWNTAGTW